MPVVTIALIAIGVDRPCAGLEPRPRRPPGGRGRRVASLFVGGGVIELVVNMLFLWLFAKSLEDTLGPVRFLAALPRRRAGRRRAPRSSWIPTRSCPRSGSRARSPALIGAYALLYPRARILVLGADPVLRHLRRDPGADPGGGLVRLQAIPAVGQPPLAGLAGGLALGLVAIRLLAHGRPVIAAEGSRAVY